MVGRVVLGVNLALASGGLGWLLWRWGPAAVAELERRPSAAWLGAFAGAFALVIACFAARWRVLLASMGARVPLARLALFRLAGQSVSAVLPTAKLAGDPLRAYYLARGVTPVPAALASVALDRLLEAGVSAAFAAVFAVLLVQRGVPALEGALVTVLAGAAATTLALGVTVRRLRRGGGVVASVMRATRLDRIAAVGARLGTVDAAEAQARAAVERSRVLARAIGLGVLASAVVLLEYHALLRAFGLPASPLAVVAAIFATGAAHSVPVPAGVGVLEGAQMFLFGALGHPPEIGLAVGLVVRVRELCWMAPGLLYVAVDAAWGLGRRAHSAPPRKPA